MILAAVSASTLRGLPSASAAAAGDFCTDIVLDVWEWSNIGDKLQEVTPAQIAAVSAAVEREPEVTLIAVKTEPDARMSSACEDGRSKSTESPELHDLEAPASIIAV